MDEDFVSTAQARAVRSEKTGPGETILGAKTETETLDRALTVVVSEDEIDKTLRKGRGKGHIRKVFR